MAVLRCKMCGGSLDIKNHESVAVCNCCGMMQTLPKLIGLWFFADMELSM